MPPTPLHPSSFLCNPRPPYSSLSSFLFNRSKFTWGYTDVNYDMLGLEIMLGLGTRLINFSSEILKSFGCDFHSCPGRNCSYFGYLKVIRNSFGYHKPTGQDLVWANLTYVRTYVWITMDVCMYVWMYVWM